MSDMDGVLVHEGKLIPGADTFVERLQASATPFLVLTNNSIYTPRDLRYRLLNSGLDIPADSIWTSALATATFLRDQRPEGSAYVIGEAGMTTALHEIGYVLTSQAPDYVVLGETRTYSFEAVTTAIRLIQGGARFVATNPDPTGPSLEGDLPATGGGRAVPRRRIEPLVASRTHAGGALTGCRLGDHCHDRRRMDTDVVAGLRPGCAVLAPSPMPRTSTASRSAEPHRGSIADRWTYRRCKPRGPDGHRRGPTGGEDPRRRHCPWRTGMGGVSAMTRPHRARR
jgi:NagD protein